MHHVTAPQFTLDDYLQLPESFPAELIEGMLVKEPSPAWWHQEITSRLHFLFRRQFETALQSPIDVFVDEHNVLQPDIAVLPVGAKPGRTRKRIPIPDIVVEVLSVSTAHRDRGIKTRTYLGAGVKEVWLVDPDEAVVEIVTRSGRETRGRGDVARSRCLSIEVDLTDLFAE